MCVCVCACVFGETNLIPLFRVVVCNVIRTPKTWITYTQWDTVVGKKLVS